MATKCLSEWTWDDYCDYMQRRACDGCWSANTAMLMIAFRDSAPKFHFNKKKKLRKWFEEHKDEILNLRANPLVCIETGEIFPNEE